MKKKGMLLCGGEITLPTSYVLHFIVGNILDTCKI